MKKILFLTALLLSLSLPLWATWSIVAVDPDTHEVGSAGASFTPSVWPILGIAGGHGVLVAQAAGNEKMRVKAVEMLLQDFSADEILRIITNHEDNPGLDTQQYGIVSLGGGSAGFTGDGCDMWRGHNGDEFVMVQGNILVSEAVIAETLSAYREARLVGLPLAEALVKALAAGSAQGGDKRSGDPAISAMTAYVAVASPEDPPGFASFALIVPPLADGGNPVHELERLYYEKRDSSHPLFFPSLKVMINLFIVLPVCLGLGLFIFLSLMKRQVKAWMALVWSTSLIVPLVVHKIIIMGLLARSWALPVYGYFSWVYLLMIALALLISFVVISVVKRIIRRPQG